jgi:hypothetical protein
MLVNTHLIKFSKRPWERAQRKQASGQNGDPGPADHPMAERDETGRSRMLEIEAEVDKMEKFRLDGGRSNAKNADAHQEPGVRKETNKQDSDSRRMDSEQSHEAQGHDHVQGSSGASSVDGERRRDDRIQPAGEKQDESSILPKDRKKLLKNELSIKSKMASDNDTDSALGAGSDNRDKAREATRDKQAWLPGEQTNSESDYRDALTVSSAVPESSTATSYDMGYARRRQRTSRSGGETKPIRLRQSVWDDDDTDESSEDDHLKHSAHAKQPGSNSKASSGLSRDTVSKHRHSSKERSAAAHNGVVKSPKQDKTDGEASQRNRDADRQADNRDMQVVKPPSGNRLAASSLLVNNASSVVTLDADRQTDRPNVPAKGTQRGSGRGSKANSKAANVRQKLVGTALCACHT